ncbi:diguanylate cyclase [Ideonella oryzae]|uniref:Diguanylate cyclase n=1 Tax=Ideonella oryzae TaxID=2937441 RepID=A0ABT1BGX2_9BURK|nr:diguanylate cyclase [Ideonella oryzae]MCO5975489.1 diguanylate cyclase [Ideonella oryzae]
MPIRFAPGVRDASRRSLVLVAAIVTSVVAALVVSLAAVSLWQERVRQRERAAAATQNLARLMDGRVGDLLGRVDMLLRLVAVRVQDQPLPVSPDLGREILAMMKAVPIVHRLCLTDGQGRLQSVWPASAGATPDLPDVDRLDWRRSDEVLQSGPFRSAAGGPWVLVYSLPWHTAAGRLAGMVHVELAVDEFGAVFKGIDLGRTGAATLRTSDTLALVYRHPWPEGSQAGVGRSEVSTQLRQAVQAAPGQGEYVAVTAVDGIPRINAYRRVQGHPLYLLVGLPETDFPKGWNRVDASVLGLALAAIVVAFLTVLSLLQRSRRAIDLMEGRCEAIVNSSRDAIISTTPEGLVTSWNPAAEALFGYRADEMLGQPMVRIFPADKLSEELALLERLRQGETIEPFETERLNQAGHRIPVSVALSPVRDSLGRVLGASRIARDITRQKAIEKEVRDLAFLDPLTRLPNRRMLMERLHRAQENTRCTGDHAAVVFVDLDHFKDLNDRHGHAVGDRLLTEVAARLQAVVRESDTVGRLGGDEFVIICEGLGQAEADAQHAALAVRDKVQRALGQPFEWGEVCHAHGASVGIRLFCGGHEDLEQLVRDADGDMYEDKARRRGSRCGSDVG